MNDSDLSRLFNENYALFYYLRFWSFFYGRRKHPINPQENSSEKEGTNLKEKAKEIKITNNTDIAWLFGYKDHSTISKQLIEPIKIGQDLKFFVFRNKSGDIILKKFDQIEQAIEKLDRATQEPDPKTGELDPDTGKDHRFLLNSFFELAYIHYYQAKINFFKDINDYSIQLFSSFFCSPYFCSFDFNDTDIKKLRNYCSKSGIKSPQNLSDNDLENELIKVEQSKLLTKFDDKLIFLGGNINEQLEDKINQANLIENSFRFLAHFFKAIAGANITKTREIDLTEILDDNFKKVLKDTCESISILKVIILSSKNPNPLYSLKEIKSNYIEEIESLFSIINSQKQRKKTTMIRETTANQNKNFYCLIEKENELKIIDITDDSHQEIFSKLQLIQNESTTNIENLFIIEVRENIVIYSSVNNYQSRGQEILNKIKQFSNTIGCDKGENNIRIYDFHKLDIYQKEQNQRRVNFIVKLTTNNKNIHSLEDNLPEILNIKKELQNRGEAGIAFYNAVVGNNTITLYLESYPTVFSRLKSLEKLADTEIIPNFHLIGVEEISNDFPPPPSRKVTKISNWLQDIFENDWFNLEEFLQVNQLQFSLGRSKSPQNLKGLKKIDLVLPLTKTRESVALVIKLNQQTPDEQHILVQVTPFPTKPKSTDELTFSEGQYLPERLKLLVILESDSAEAIAREADNSIQLGFVENVGKSFKIKLELGEVTYEEEFIL
jgi:hypothetical protein